MKSWKMVRPSDRTSCRICLVVLLKCLVLGPALTFSVQTMGDRQHSRRFDLMHFIPPPFPRIDDDFRDNGFSRELREVITNGARDKRVFSNCYGWGPGCNGRSRMLNNRRDLIAALNQPLQSAGGED